MYDTNLIPFLSDESPKSPLLGTKKKHRGKQQCPLWLARVVIYTGISLLLLVFIVGTFTDTLGLRPRRNVLTGELQRGVSFLRL